MRAIIALVLTLPLALPAQQAAPAAPKSPVKFEVTIEKADSTHQLVLTDRGGAFFTGQVGVGPGWSGCVYHFERAFSSDQANFVRAEVRQQDGKAIESLGNPIYITAGGATPAKPQAAGMTR